MARNRINVPLQGQRYPRLTQPNGQMLTNQQIGQNIDKWMDEAIIEESRMAAFVEFNERRQIRLATGVGNIAAYAEQFNKGFAETSQLSPDKSVSGKEAFGVDWANRPRLRKISREGRIVYIPRQGF